MRVEDVEAYEIIEKREIGDLNSTGYLCRHKKTGARVALLSNQEENKVFYIGFRTPPEDSTGVAHILEHSVLCGSRKYPIKDPFIELCKGSLNTFLNAMTYPDKTVYPVASCNEKDFKNLMDVYLDAVFYPHIYEDDKIFRQEGWHYELEDPQGELTVNGVVYNEMKGAFSSPDDRLDREIMNALYPDTTYSVESGGDPDVIPSLTYEDFLAFHSRYYHPSNSYIYLYGDMDMAERLVYLDEAYLSHFDRLEIDSDIAGQQPFRAPEEWIRQFPVTEAEPVADNTYLSYNTVVGDSLDRELYLAFQVLDYALCSAPGAPLKQTLTDAGIGKDVYSYFENGIRQPFFSIVAKNANLGQKETFVSLIETKLKELTEKGISQKALYAGLNYYEFKYREGDFGSYPAGLMYGLQALDSWLYDEKRPFIHIEAGATFASLKNKVESGYFEELVRRYLLENTHKAVVILEPKRGLEEEKAEQLQTKLAAYKETLTEEQLKELVRRTGELRAFQDAQDSPEALQKIPVLKREDIKKEAQGFVNEPRSLPGNGNNTTVLVHELFTNRITYLRLVFDLSHIAAEDLPYVGVLKNILGMVDTEAYPYAELFNEINIQTGGMEPVVNIYQDARDLDSSMCTLELKIKMLQQNAEKALGLAEEMLLHSRLTDSKRLYDILAETRSRMQASMINAGHQVAASRALSYQSRPAVLSEALTGMSCYRLIEELEHDFETKKEELTAKLERLMLQIFRPEKLFLDYTGDGTDYEALLPLLAGFRSRLHTEPVEEAEQIVTPVKKNEGFLSSSQVQYVCRAGNFLNKGLPYTGALRVLREIMSLDYLWTQVRVKGGAYGCMCSFSKNGNSYFVSYRDPKLAETIDVFERAAAFVEQFEADERSMTQFVIGTIGQMDMPLTPAAKGLRSMAAYLTNQTEADMQKERDEVLSATAEEIRRLAAYIRAFLADDCLCVVGNETALKKQSGLFMTLENYFRPEKGEA